MKLGFSSFTFYEFDFSGHRLFQTLNGKVVRDVAVSTCSRARDKPSEDLSDEAEVKVSLLTHGSQKLVDSPQVFASEELIGGYDRPSKEDFTSRKEMRSLS